MKPGTLTFQIPPNAADAGGPALPTALPSLIRLLMGLTEWPEDHGIRVRGRGQRAPLVYARVALSRHVVEILFDPATGRFECTNCQATGFDLPPSIPDDPRSGFITAVMRGLTAAAATALLQGATVLLQSWPTLAAIDAGGTALDDEGSAVTSGAVHRKPAV
ncbi:hypothetical protein [Mitsuaria sp. 7]|uniref:hypothetical protein n=1 Tax=Mitsuaria sp. 7 TaxID=1658665 RepID=UPI0007DDFF74|nr:hypothetical protein [Mitsuaria sp. 7]ANH67047.1 hypothetical protein ABE85_04735 [Mitsuaria sp. 7]